MKAKGYPFQHLYFVVEALADAVGLPVFPAVLYVSAPVPDGAGSGADLLHLGGGVFMDPFGKIFVLYRIREGKDDVMEELQGFIGLIKLRSNKRPPKDAAGSVRTGVPSRQSGRFPEFLRDDG